MLSINFQPNQACASSSSLVVERTSRNREIVGSNSAGARCHVLSFVFFYLKSLEVCPKKVSFRDATHLIFRINGLFGIELGYTKRKIRKNKITRFTEM